MALYHSSLRRFEDSTCMASSRGPPSSLIKHGSKVSFLAFLAHSCLSPLTSGLFQGRVHDPGRRTKDGFSAFHALLQPLFTRGAELASRSDTGLRKQTGEGEAFTGGGMSLPPKIESVPVFRYNGLCLNYNIDTLLMIKNTGGKWIKKTGN